MAYDDIQKMLGRTYDVECTFEVVYACTETGVVLLRCSNHNKTTGKRTLYHRFANVEEWLDS